MSSFLRRSAWPGVAFACVAAAAVHACRTTPTTTASAPARAVPQVALPPGSDVTPDAHALISALSSRIPACRERAARQEGTMEWRTADGVIRKSRGTLGWERCSGWSGFTETEVLEPGGGEAGPRSFPADDVANVFDPAFWPGAGGRPFHARVATVDGEQRLRLGRGTRLDVTLRVGRAGEVVQKRELQRATGETGPEIITDYEWTEVPGGGLRLRGLRMTYPDGGTSSATIETDDDGTCIHPRALTLQLLGDRGTFRYVLGAPVYEGRVTMPADGSAPTERALGLAEGSVTTEDARRLMAEVMRRPFGDAGCGLARRFKALASDADGTTNTKEFPGEITCTSGTNAHCSERLDWMPDRERRALGEFPDDAVAFRFTTGFWWGRRTTVSAESLPGGRRRLVFVPDEDMEDLRVFLEVAPDGRILTADIGYTNGSLSRSYAFDWREQPGGRLELAGVRLTPDGGGDGPVTVTFDSRPGPAGPELEGFRILRNATPALLRYRFEPAPPLPPLDAPAP